MSLLRLLWAYYLFFYILSSSHKNQINPPFLQIDIHDLHTNTLADLETFFSFATYQEMGFFMKYVVIVRQKS